MSNYIPARGGNPANTGQFSSDGSRRGETDIDSNVEPRTIEDIEMELEDLLEEMEEANSPHSDVTVREYREMANRRIALDSEKRALENAEYEKNDSVRAKVGENIQVSDAVEKRAHELAEALSDNTPYVWETEYDFRDRFAKVLTAASTPDQGIPEKVDMYGREQDYIAANKDLKEAQHNLAEANSDLDSPQHVAHERYEEFKRAEERAVKANTAWEKAQRDSVAYRAMRKHYPNADRKTHEAIAEVVRSFRPEYVDAVYADVAALAKQQKQESGT